MSVNTSNRTKIMIQLGFIVLACLIAFFVLRYVTSLQTSSGSSNVRFEVEASGGFASITLITDKEIYPDPTTVTVPWVKTIKIQSGTTVILTASNPTATGTITCRIFLDGVSWKKETTVSPKNGVACAGIVP